MHVASFKELENCIQFELSTIAEEFFYTKESFTSRILRFTDNGTRALYLLGPWMMTFHMTYPHYNIA